MFRPTARRKKKDENRRSFARKQQMAVGFWGRDGALTRATDIANAKSISKFHPLTN
jgi:hypothetical protein